jgi:hypothetical protein
MEMVGNRHSKGALVDLVNWLLVSIRTEREACAAICDAVAIAAVQSAGDIRQRSK